MLGIGEFIAALVVSLVIVQYLKLRWAARGLPPGPTPLPIIGSLWQMNFKFQHENLIMVFNFIFSCITNSCILMISGIIFTSGPTWKQQRRFGLAVLRSLGLGKKGLEHRIQEEARHLVEAILSEKGQPLDPFFPIIHSVSNVICAMAFGRRFSNDDETFCQLIENNNFMFRFGGSIYHNLYDVSPRLMHYLPGPHQKIFACHDFLRSFTRQEIQHHKDSGTPEEPQDFIDFYLAQMAKSNDGPSTFDEGNMVQSICDFFLAGTETTTTTLRWALLFMLIYPDVQEKVQKELDDVLGLSRLICYEDRKKLPYTNAVIHEIQRYSNIVSVGVPRQCIKDTTVLGFLLKKDTIIIPNLSSVLLDPEQWETPRQFNPNHFLDKDGHFVSSEAFLPFSVGHRVCLGEQLARIELFIFFTSLLQAFTFQLPEGMKAINTEYILGMTLQPHPYKVCAVPH
uniref:Cytochrome P450 family 2 subfamily AB member 16 n=1 Tax=Sphenodon punctatus TaxID=8508 RepID=A0A8D0H936_SPHPU